MDQVTPAVTLRDASPRPHSVLSVLAVLTALWSLGSLGGLTMELLGGANGVFEYRGSAIPLWAVLLGSALVASYATWDTYMGAVMTGSSHGLIDCVVEPTGIRLRRLRTWGRALEVPVQHGGTVHISAVLVSQRRSGVARHYRFTVSTEGGSFDFTQAIHIEKLTLRPLEEVARPMGIQVETSGEAVAIGADG